MKVLIVVSHQKLVMNRSYYFKVCNEGLD